MNRIHIYNFFSLLSVLILPLIFYLISFFHLSVISPLSNCHRLFAFVIIFSTIFSLPKNAFTQITHSKLPITEIHPDLGSIHHSPPVLWMHAHQKKGFHEKKKNQAKEQNQNLIASWDLQSTTSVLNAEISIDNVPWIAFCTHTEEKKDFKNILKSLIFLE